MNKHDTINIDGLLAGGFGKLGKNRQNKANAILTESAKLFRHKGFAATSMDEIAAAVGLSKGSIFHYYRNKEEILHKLTIPALEDGVDLLCKTIESDITPKEKLAKAIRNHLDVIDQYAPMLFMVTEQDLNCISKQMREQTSALLAEYEHMFQGIIAEGVTVGQFRADLDVKFTTRAILAMCNDMLRQYRRGDASPTKQTAEQYITLVSKIVSVESDGAPGISRKPLFKISRSESPESCATDVHSDVLPLAQHTGMDSCPRCSGVEVIKSGFVGGNQRFRCLICGFQYTRSIPRGRPLKDKVLAIFLYLHGMSMRSIGEIMGVSTVTVSRWIRAFSERYADQPEPEGTARVMGPDEMWRYLDEKSTSPGHGRLVIDIEGSWLIGNVGVVMSESARGIRP